MSSSMCKIRVMRIASVTRSGGNPASYHKQVFMRCVPLCILFLFLVGGGPSGCSANRTAELAAFSSITFTAPGFYLPRGSSLQWRSDLVYIFDEPAEAPGNVKPFLQSEIEAYLASRSYSFVEEGSAADFGIVAAIVLGDEMTARDVLRQYRLTPSFKASRYYEKGTIVVALYDTADERVQWRGAIQASVDLAMPVEQRRLLIRSHVRRLLAMLPDSPPLM